MGARRDDLMDTTMVRMPDGSYLPAADLRNMNAMQLGEIYKARGGFGSTLDTGTGIQSAQEMFNQTYEEAMANEYLANILEGQGVPDVVPFSIEDALRPVNVSDGIDEFEANYVKDLLDQGLLTVSDVAQQTGIPEQDIQNTYNQMSGRPLFDVLNDPTDATAGLINLTVGSNQMLDDAALAAAQAAAQPDAAAQETVDLTEDTTASTITGGLGNGSLGDAADLGTVSPDTVSDVNEEWTYDKDTDSFISSTRGDRIPNRGNADLRDGAVYTLTPVIGTDGVEAEHVVDTETKESVGIFNIDINTGLPSIIKSVDTRSTVDIGGLDNGGIGDTGIGDTGVGDGGVGSGDDFNTARDTSNIGKVLTVGSTPSTETSTVTKGIDGKDGANGVNGVNGQDGRDGIDGKNGKDGKDGMIGLFSSIQNTPITESILFTPKFTKLENVQQGMFDAFLRAAGGNR